MGDIRTVQPAALVAGITYSDDEALENALTSLCGEFGPLASKSASFAFTMTDYYTEEMGGGLSKLFCCFERPITLDALPDIKVRTNALELLSAVRDGSRYSRKVNIDPGYVTLSKLVLVTTKDYSHRIYIGKGIFAEVTLRFQGKSFQPLETTYPDYRTELTLTFFNSVREFVKENRSLWEKSFDRMPDHPPADTQHEVK